MIPLSDRKAKLKSEDSKKGFEFVLTTIQYLNEKQDAINLKMIRLLGKSAKINHELDVAFKTLSNIEHND